jgi:hypothetical protein
MYLTQINDTIHKKIRGRNNRTLSNLSTFIRVFSGANKTGLVIESNPDWKLFNAAGENSEASVYGSYSDGSGTIGVTWANKTPIQATAGAPAKPRPVITLFNVKEGQDQISKEANLNITAFSIEQLELIQQYFMEPGYSLFVEWGWNTPDGVKGLIKSDTVANIKKDVGNRALTDSALQDTRITSRGDYDCFFGFITGGEVTSEGNLFNVNIQMRGVPSLPAFLQSHHSLYTYTKENGPLTSTTFPLYGPSELQNGSKFGNLENNSGLQDIKDKRFKSMFNNLPPIKQTQEVANLLNDCEWYDFIGFDLDVIKNLESKFDVTWLERTGYFFGVIENPAEVLVSEFGVPVEKFVSDEKYIRFGLAVDILNANAKTVKYNISGKELKSYINTKDTKIGAFPFIFSTKKENLLIPGQLPKFTEILKNPNGMEYIDFTKNETGVDLRIPIATGNGYISFVQTGEIGFPTKDKEGKPVPAAANTFKEISEYYGLLENLYINFEFFKNTITTSNKNVREILNDLLNGMSAAVNGFWNFQIIETVGDDDLLSIKVFDENWVGQQKDLPTWSFAHQGTDSVFLDASLNVKIPAEMMGQIINRRFNIASQPEQAIINVDKDRKADTFFAKGADLFLDVRIGNTITPPSAELTIEDGLTASTSTQSGTTDNTSKWEKPDVPSKEQIEAKKTETQTKANQAESLDIVLTEDKYTQNSDVVTTYYYTSGKKIIAYKISTPGLEPIYRGESPEKAKAYDNLTNESDVVREIDERKDKRLNSFNKSLDRMDFLVRPNKSAEFNTTKTDAFTNGNLSDSFGIYCYDDPIYFDKLKNHAFGNYFTKKNGKGLLSPLLPITYKFKILGSSGLRRWDFFVVTGIPKKYLSNGVWQITEIEHGLSGMQWVTEVTANYRQQQ